MAVNGQPKSMAEYIQATSRVGRQKVPGLIVTQYNAGRPRDRAHYESFRSWHQMLYREVEATSVTPFAPRARDKALHAAVVALVRHLVPNALDNPTLDAVRYAQARQEVQCLIARAQSVDPDEDADTSDEAYRFIDEWRARGTLQSYWADKAPKTSLLVSAETHARALAAGGGVRGGRSTPNSMREVEPEVELRVVPRLAVTPPSGAPGMPPGGAGAARRGFKRGGGN